MLTSKKSRALNYTTTDINNMHSDSATIHANDVPFLSQVLQAVVLAFLGDVRLNLFRASF